MNDDQVRGIVARQIALYQAVEILLAAHIASFGREFIDKWEKMALEEAERTDQLTGSAPNNEFAAEMLADITVRFHQAFRELVARAKARAEAGFPKDEAP
jgi:hypothetical protein